jgi:hypothetical protein
MRRNVIDAQNKGTIRLFAWLPLVTIIGDASLSERRVTPLLASSQSHYGHNYGAMLPPRGSVWYIKLFYTFLQSN